MNRQKLSMIAAALVVVLSARAVRAQDVLARCNPSATDVELMAKEVGACRAWVVGAHAAEKSVRASAGAVEKSTINTAVVTVSTILVNGAMVKAVAADPALVERLSYYFAYEAFASGNPARCAVLTKVINQAILCRDVYEELNYTRARMGPRADFMRACLQRRDMTSRDISREQLPAWCAAIADNGNDPAVLCSKLLPMLSGFKNPHESPPTMTECQAAFASYKGDASRCSTFPADRRAGCEGDAAFVKAFKAKDISLCGASERCQVLMGDGKRVLRGLSARMTSPAAQYVLTEGWKTTVAVPSGATPAPAANAAAVNTAAKPADFKGFVCADPLWSEANRKAALSTVKAAQVCVTDVDGVLAPNLAIAQGVDSRLEKIARLQLQINAAMEPGELGAQPKSPVAPRKAR